MKNITFDPTQDWFHESNVSRMLVAHLKSNGYQILKDNSDNCSARGEDIIAISPEGGKEVIEVKGFPTKLHTKGALKGELKKSKPDHQAKHWFSEVIVTSIFNYRKHRDPKTILAIAFPNFEKYRKLQLLIHEYFTDNNLSMKVYSVDEDGTITSSNLNKLLK